MLINVNTIPIIGYGDSFHVMGLRSFVDDSLVTPLGPATGDCSRTTSLSLLGDEVTELISEAGQSLFSGSSMSYNEINIDNIKFKINITN